VNPNFLPAENQLRDLQEAARAPLSLADEVIDMKEGARPSWRDQPVQVRPR
jgi:hypothetical protein